MKRKLQFRRLRIQSHLFFLLGLLVFGMGIGYAAINQSLEIDGVSDIESSSWSVFFDNVQVTTGSVTAATPTISDLTSVSFSARLEKPGDFYEFSVDAVNDGSLDALIDSITITPTLTENESKFFEYTVTYGDGVSIQEGDALDAGDQETILIRFEYKIAPDTDYYPTSDANFDFSVNVSYSQGKGNAVR